MVNSAWPKKKKNLLEMLKGFRQMPRAIAQASNIELKSYILEGNPIHRQEGHLIASWNVREIRGFGAVMFRTRNLSEPYAAWVMVDWARFKTNETALELLMNRMKPRIDRELLAEFKHIERTINAGGDYKFDKAAFERRLKQG